MSLYLQAITREVKSLRALGLNEKEISLRIKKKFERGLGRSQSQTSNWRKIAAMVLNNEPLSLNENNSIIFYQE